MLVGINLKTSNIISLVLLPSELGDFKQRYMYKTMSRFTCHPLFPSPHVCASPQSWVVSNSMHGKPPAANEPNVFEKK